MEKVFFNTDLRQTMLGCILKAEVKVADLIDDAILYTDDEDVLQCMIRHLVSYFDVSTFSIKPPKEPDLTGVNSTDEKYLKNAYDEWVAFYTGIGKLDDERRNKHIAENEGSVSRTIIDAFVLTTNNAMKRLLETSIESSDDSYPDNWYIIKNSFARDMLFLMVYMLPDNKREIAFESFKYMSKRLIENDFEFDDRDFGHDYLIRV